jgi:DNA sulfur modification protein DndD
LEQSRISRNIEHLERAKATVEKFKEALILRDIARIENSILESAQMLFSKQKLISRVKVDPHSFHLSIFDSANEEFSPHQLSAGERQILAISILWGLSKASGKSLPVFIDTPLGRLDHDHRDKLVATYFHKASHQTVLLSTEEEITPSRFRAMSAWVGNICSLIYEESTQCSHFEMGRFFEDVQPLPNKSQFSASVR